MNDWEAQRRLPCFSEQLSSLHRPAAQAAAHDGFVGLHPPLLHHLLSFVDLYELFFILPRLSRSLARSFTHPDLHRLYGQQRFRLNSQQWLEFSQQAWPQLHVPVHKLAYYEGWPGFGQQKATWEPVVCVVTDELQRHQQARQTRTGLRRACISLSTFDSLL
jgi:hypothetical protein